MKEFTIADTHFGHGNIIKFCPEMRGTFTNGIDTDGNIIPDPDSMTETLIQNWNSVVSNDDVVWHLGDVAFGSDFSFLDRLNGKINLIRGNHDHKILKTHGHRFENVFDLKEIKVNKKPYVLCHYRMMVWNRSHHGVKHLFGHSHNRIPSTQNAMDVGVDNPLWNFRPASFEQIEEVSKTLPENLPEGFTFSY